MKKVGANLLTIGILIGFLAILSQSVAFGYVALGCILLGGLPFVLQPVLPKQVGSQRTFTQPATVAGGKSNLINRDRRRGNPPY